MYDSQLLQYFSILNANDRRELRKFVRSPYHNQREDVAYQPEQSRVKVFGPLVLGGADCEARERRRPDREDDPKGEGDDGRADGGQLGPLRGERLCEPRGAGGSAEPPAGGDRGQIAALRACGRNH